MPWLSAQKVYTEDELVKTYLRAGQFVHIAERDMKETLSLVYDEGLRQRTSNRSEKSHGAYRLWWNLKEAASPELIAICSRKKFPRLYMADGATNIIKRNHGMFCSVCFEVHYPLEEQWHLRFMTSNVARFFCPTVLGIVKRYNPDERKHSYNIDKCNIWSPLCFECHYGITSTKEYKKIYHHGCTDEERLIAYISGLTWLATKSKTFRMRLNQCLPGNKWKRPKTIRFNPRKLDHVHRNAA